MEAEGVMLAHRLPDPWHVFCVSSVPLADVKTWSALYSMPQFASLHILPSGSLNPRALVSAGMVDFPHIPMARAPRGFLHARLFWGEMS